MAQSGQQIRISKEAAADLRTKRYHFVLLDSNGRINQASFNNAEINIGVLQNKPDALGRVAAVSIAGETKITAGAVVAVGEYLTTNGSGRAIEANSGAWIGGMAMEAAGADGDVIRMVQFTWHNGSVTA